MKKLWEYDIINHLILTVSTIVLFPTAMLVLFGYIMREIWVDKNLRYAHDSSNEGMEKVGKWCGCEIKATKGLLDDFRGEASRG
jgi:hypothetical protein